MRKKSILNKMIIILITLFCALSISVSSYATNIDIPGLFGDDVKIKGTQENIDIKRNYGTRIFDLGEGDKNKNPKNNNGMEDLLTKTDKKGKKLNKNVKQNIENRSTKLSELGQSTLINLDKLKEKYNGRISLAIILYILNILAVIFIPLTLILLIISFSHDKIFKDDEKRKKDGRKKRLIILTIFAIIELLPLLFTIITKGWIN